MRASIVRSFLIALVIASLFGTVPAAAGNEAPSGSTMSVLDSSGATAPGATRWSDRYTLVGSFSDLATALATSPDGSEVFVTGESDGSGTGYDCATVAYDASTGATLWSRRYNGPGNGADRPNDVAVSPDGSEVFVTGYSGGRSTSGDLNYDYATVAYDTSTGAQLWVSRYTSRGDRTDAATALEVSPDGSQVFVTGGSAGPTSDDDDFATVAYDASTGTKLWAKRYSRLGNDFAWAAGVSPDGSEVIVSGHSFGSTSGADYATVAYDVSTGATLWSKRYTGPGNGLDSPRAVGVSPDGSAVFVTGLSDGLGTGSDYATVAYDVSTGARLWSRRYSRPGEDVAYALGVSPDGSAVFVTGTSQGTSSLDYSTMAYDSATGAKIWVKRYSGFANGFDSASALGVSPDGSEVFVTGQSHGSSGGSDYATRAYDASTGAKLWSERYNGPANGLDWAAALGVSTDGSKVFVTGASEGSSSGMDYATVAYGVT